MTVFKAWLVSGQPAHWEQTLGLVLYMLFEKFLPNSKQLRANSTIELVGNMLKPAIGKLPLVKAVVTWMASPEPPTHKDETPPPGGEVKL